MEARKKKCTGYGQLTSVVWIGLLGLAASAAIGLPIRRIEGWGGSPSELASLIVCGIGAAYAVLSALEWLVQWRSLSTDLLPDDLDLSDRSIAAERLAALKGCTILHRHVRRLLTAWAAGASGPQVAAMAGNQTMRLMGTLVVETAAILALLAATASFIPPQVLLTLSTGLMALLILVGVARLQLASHLAGYVESNLLARIGNDTPAAAGLEFAGAVGKSVADSTAALAAAQDQSAAQIAKAQTSAAAQMAKIQGETAEQIGKVQREAAEKIAAAQTAAAAQIAKAQDKVAEQLGRIGEMAARIDEIFKLQQAVGGVLKEVAAADEFKSALSEFKRHLAASDALLQNAAKPRTIRLVEKDGE